MDTMLPARPESSLKLLKRSLILYGASFARVYLLALLLSFVVFIPRLFVDLTGHNILPSMSLTNLSHLWIILLNLAGILIFVALIWRIHCVAREVHEPLVEDFKIGIRKVLSVFIAALLQSFILIGVALITLGIQYVLHRNHLLFNQSTGSEVLTLSIFIGQFFLILYISTLFIFFVPLITIEDKGIFASLECSIFLAWNHWWRVLTLQLIPWILYVCLLVAFRFIFNINVNIYFLENMPHSVWITLMQIIIFALFVIWPAALLLVQLKDLELRKHLTY